MKIKNKLKKWLQRIHTGNPCGPASAPGMAAALGAIYGNPHTEVCTQAIESGIRISTAIRIRTDGRIQILNLRSAG